MRLIPMQTLINNIFGYISNNDLFGVLPLDIICHVFVGLFMTKLFLRMKFSFTTIIVAVTALAIGKEYYDSFVLYNGNKTLEHLKDIFFTLIPILFMYLSFHAKKSVESQSLSV
jgi:hypothetical protein